MSRREARTLAMKSLFSLDFTTDVSPLDTVKALLEDEDTPALPKDDENYAAALVTGTREHLEAIDSVLDTLSDEWKVKRMAGVDRNLLRMAAFEMYFSPQKIAPAIAISEAVEIAKIYGGDDSPHFINGLLGTLVRNHGKDCPWH
jgi:N utilization substance protein B